MLTRDKILKDVQHRLQNLPASAKGKWHLCWDGQNCRLLTAELNYSKWPIITKFSAKNVLEGFTAKEWDYIVTKIVQLKKETSKCPSKPIQPTREFIGRRELSRRQKQSPY